MDNFSDTPNRILNPEYFERVRELRKRFPDSEGILFVIETNKQLRAELAQYKTALETVEDMLNAEKIKLQNCENRYMEEYYKRKEAESMIIHVDIPVKDLANRVCTLNDKVRKQKEEINLLKKNGERMVSMLRHDNEKLFNKLCVANGIIHDLWRVAKT